MGTNIMVIKARALYLAERIKDEWRSKHTGGCKLLSTRGNCTCVLCCADDLRTIVDTLTDRLVASSDLSSRPESDDQEAKQS